MTDPQFPQPPHDDAPLPAHGAAPAPTGNPTFPGVGGTFAVLGVDLLASGILILAAILISMALGIGQPESVVWIGVEGGMVIAILWGWRRTGLPFSEVFPLRPVPLRLIAAIALGLPGFLFVEEKLLALQFRIVPPSDALLELLNQDVFESGLIAVIVGVILAPVLEELLFRGLLLRGLLIRKGALFACLFTAVLFAVLHVIPYFLIPFTLLGGILAWLTWKSRSLVPAIVAHVLNNLLALSEDLGWLPRDPEDLVVSRDWTGPEWWQVAVGIAVFALAYEWARSILRELETQGGADA